MSDVIVLPVVRIEHDGGKARIRRRRVIRNLAEPFTVGDLGQVRAARERPDAEHVRQDEYGRSLYRFALTYEMDGSTWGAEVWAYSFEDAERRVAAMRGSLSVAGQVHREIAG